MTSVFINEFHYDNADTDVGEFIEIAGPVGTDLTGWSIELYNGANSSVYNLINLGGSLSDQSNGFGFSVINFPSNGIQNGSPDGIALIDSNDTVVEFLSYEGSFTATDGTAAGQTSTDIGVAEDASTPVGNSLQRTGTGSQSTDFTWGLPAANTSGAVNTGQSFTSPAPATVFISEIHYDNSGTDTGEFVEISGSAGANLSGYSLVLYNGNDGAVYSTVAIGGVIPDEGNGQGAIAFDITGIQNGAPDGIALIAPDNGVVEFLSYEGTFAATGGPAGGLTSTDIGVAEDDNTSVGQSLQLLEEGWSGPLTASQGVLNTASNGGGGTPVDRFIHEIQGSGNVSPLVGNEVTIEAVVIGDFQDGSGTNGDLNGFFVQEEDADADGNPATSEGIFIFDGSAPGVDVQVGDVVLVTGTVEEFDDLTELTNVTVSVTGTAPLPKAATVNFPIAAVDDLEAFEGMQITIPDTLFVTEYFNLDRFGEVVLSSNGSSNAPGTDGRLDQYTQFNAPDVAGFTAYQADIAKRRIVLDDGQTIQNPDPIIHGRGGQPLSADNTLRGGDTVNNLSGILSYGFGDYRIQPTNPIDFQPTNPRPATPEAVGGDLKVASFNVLNFFTTLDAEGNPGSGPDNLEPRGANSQEEFDRQLQKLVTTLDLMDADIVGLIELENEFGGDQNGDGQFAIATLVTALNAVSDSTYAFVDPGRPFVDTGDAISVGAIYKTDTVQLAPGTTVEILDDSDLAGLGLNFGNAVFDGDRSNRASLAATFEEIATGEALTIAVNHFKSKGSINDAPGNTDMGDGAGNNNAIRLQASQALDAWLDTDPTGSGDPDFLVVGDLNSYAQEDPITFLEDEGYTNVFNNPATAYSYVFDGQFGTLDYGLANSTLISQVTGATEWHVNADEPDALDYNLDFGRNPALFDGTEPYRNSDHDPLIIGLDLFTETSTPTSGFLSFELAAQVLNTLGLNIPYTPVEINGLNLGQFFDNGYYLNQNPDVAQAVTARDFGSGFEHFVQFGWLEGRNGSILFDEQTYLSENIDVANAIGDGGFSSGFQHFVLFGHQEGRDPSEVFSQADYLANNPDVNAAVQANVFGSGFEHYVEFGAREGRLPERSLYQEDFYIAQNPDVASAVIAGDFGNGFEHFVFFGASEGRDPSALFNNEAYLAANPDVANAVMMDLIPSGFIHYALFGGAEGRPLA